MSMSCVTAPATRQMRAIGRKRASRMITLVFTDGTTTEFGRAEADAVPRVGDGIWLDFEVASSSFGRFRVDAVEWDLKNISRVDKYTYPYSSGARTMVMLTVSALDEKTQAFMDRVKQESEQASE